MKILLLTSFFPPTHTAGTEKRTLGYASQLINSGHDVQVICVGKWDEGQRYWNGVKDEIYLDIPVKRIHLNWTLAPDPNTYLYRNPMIAKELGNWMKNFQPDVIHITSCYTLTASVIEVISELKIPLVLTLTDFWFICPKHTLLRFDNSLCDGRTTNHECLDCMLYRNKTYQKLRPILDNSIASIGIEWASRQKSISNKRGLRGMALDMGDRKDYLNKMIKLPDVVLAPSSYLSDVFTSSGISREIRVIRSGHDLSWLSSTPQRDATGLIHFGYIGQITPIKGLHVLISAFKIDSLEDRAKLLIYGSASQESVYQESLLRSINGKQQSISLQGGFPHTQLGEVLSEIDVLVVPSLWHENNPRVIQEAFAAKTPVIGSNVGGIAEFVKHDENGLLYERNDEIDLAHQLSRVVNDPGLLQHLRDGIKPVKKIEKEVEEIIAIYKELIH